MMIIIHFVVCFSIYRINIIIFNMMIIRVLLYKSHHSYIIYILKLICFLISLLNIIIR